MVTALLLFTWSLQTSREVLCLYDSTERRTAEVNEIHMYAELVLNYLGLTAVYRDANGELPDDGEMERYRGVLTWFQDTRLREARAYWKWLSRQAERGKKVVILGHPGATEGVSEGEINASLRAMGLTYEQDGVEGAPILAVARKDELLDFERPVELRLSGAVRMRSAPTNRVHLRAERTDGRAGGSDLVVTGPWGGFAWVALHFDDQLCRAQWQLDPFAFFERALDVQGEPRLDFTTAMGRRILFLHVDGDGIVNRVRQGPRIGRMCGEVMRDEFFRKIDLPFTASVIAHDLVEASALARSIFELPNIEVAAHGYFHPLDWQRKTLAYRGEFSLDREVEGSVAAINELSPKPVRSFLWTGNCDPPVEAIEMCDRMGIANINGTDSAFDHRRNSYAHVRPAAIHRSGRLQFNARAMSETLYTESWTRNFFAFREVIATYERTESPRRIAPINVYFHYYVVEQPAGEAALRAVLDWVQRQRTYPMTVSEYVSWVRGFHDARVRPAGPRRWRIEGYGACRTVRFDGSREFVDLDASSNVLGFLRQGRTLYVHLGRGDEAVVALTDTAPGGAYLVEANGDWHEGKIVSHAAAYARLMTPQGEVEARSTVREVEVKLP